MRIKKNEREPRNNHSLLHWRSFIFPILFVGEFVKPRKKKPLEHPELKPCPFCGSDQILIQNVGLYWAIHCNANKKRLCAAYMAGSTMEEVCEIWNRRV